MKPSLLLLFSLLVRVQPAAGPSLHYRPPAKPIDDRPVPVDVTATPQGNDIALKITFDKVPWGEDCKLRCANTTLLLDTDDNRTTGLQMGKGQAETGADLAITVEGAREYKEKSAEALLRARVRQLADGTTRPEQGELIADLDHRHDLDRVRSNGKTVLLLLDATRLTLPSGKTLRLIYHPPGGKALQATGKGMLMAGSVKYEAFQGSKGQGKRRRR